MGGECTVAKLNTEYWYDAEPWRLVRKSPDFGQNIYDEIVMSQSNGYMGMSAYPEEIDDGFPSRREGYLAGISAYLEGEPLQAMETDAWPMVDMVGLPAFFSCELSFGGEVFSLNTGEILDFEKSLDLTNAVLRRKIRWKSEEGKVLQLEFLRFISSAKHHIAAQRIRVTPENWEGEAILSFKLDGNVITPFRPGMRVVPNYPQKHFRSIDAHATDGVGVINAVVFGSEHEVSIAAGIDAGTEVELSVKGEIVNHIVHRRVGKSKPAIIDRVIGVVTSKDDDMGGNPENASVFLVKEGLAAGFDTLLERNTKIWQNRWQIADITLEGCDHDQKTIRINLFHLLQLGTFHSDRVSIPARGLAFNRYLGQYFWDCEVFVLPFFTFVFPETAKKLLRFRYHGLKGARENARHLGGEGAAYPFTTDADHGNEQAPFQLGTFLLHQTAGIAYAIDQYASVTGDSEFLLDYGLEILIETARFWASRVFKDAKGIYHTDGTDGPDECAASKGLDNGYTNLMLRKNLESACFWIEKMRSQHNRECHQRLEALNLRAEEMANWQDIVRNLSIPTIPGTDIPLQDEHLLSKKVADIEGWNLRDHYSTWRIDPYQTDKYRVVSQSDILLAMFLLRDLFRIKQLAEAYDFYEPITIHHSSLSSNTNIMIASILGRKEEAYRYFHRTACIDINNINDAISDGLHTANIGGTWQGVVMGFGGMKLENEQLVFNPSLPEAWDSLKFKVIFRGKLISVSLAKDKSQEIREEERDATG